MTFGELVQAYLQHLGTKPSRAKYTQIYNQFFRATDWHLKLAGEVTRIDVLLLRQSLEATPPHANKTIGFIRQAYTWAMNRIDQQTRRAFYEGRNPAEGIRGYVCLSRERLADRNELTIMLNDMDNLSAFYEACFGIRFLVPCRLKELCGLRRDAVDASGKWAKGKTKNGRTHYILIPRQGMELLAKLPNRGPYYFPGCYDQPIQEGSIRKVWQRWRQKLSQVYPEIKDLQLLDMRRVYASYLYTEVKADELFVKAALNHYDARPLAIYTRLNYDHLAAVGQAYADWVWNMRLESTMEGSHAKPIDLLSVTDRTAVLQLRPFTGGVVEATSASSVGAELDAGAESAAGVC